MQKWKDKAEWCERAVFPLSDIQRKAVR